MASFGLPFANSEPTFGLALGGGAVFGIAIDSHTRTQLAAADFVLSLDLADYDRTDADQSENLFSISGTGPLQRHMGQHQPSGAIREDYSHERLLPDVTASDLGCPYCRASTRDCAQILTQSATSSQPRSDIMLCAIPGKIPACVR